MIQARTSVITSIIKSSSKTPKSTNGHKTMSKLKKNYNHSANILQKNNTNRSKRYNKNGLSTTTNASNDQTKSVVMMSNIDTP